MSFFIGFQSPYFLVFPPPQRWPLIRDDVPFILSDESVAAAALFFFFLLYFFSAVIFKILWAL
jgi:hypothetical protein